MHQVHMHACMLAYLSASSIQEREMDVKIVCVYRQHASNCTTTNGKGKSKCVCCAVCACDAVQVVFSTHVGRVSSEAASSGEEDDEGADAPIPMESVMGTCHVRDATAARQVLLH